jgi:hydroxymethylbilane synthase
VEIESTGDIQLTKPIYELGVTGVFTKQLDVALLNNEADIAVHSLKDVPTQLAEGLTIASVLERGSYEDVLLHKSDTAFENKLSLATVATSSLRRRAQWLSKYPKHSIVPIRGNVQTRLSKFSNDEAMNGVIFAKAGLERLNLLPADAITLHWMLPAPAQGIVGIACRVDDDEMVAACRSINHQPSFIVGTVERSFMRTLMGGCSVPISALATISGDSLKIRGSVDAFDGTRSFNINRTVDLKEWKNAGKASAEILLQQPGAAELIEEIRKGQIDK